MGANMLDKKKLANQLAVRLRELADACEKAADGDKDACKLLESNTDLYWHGLVVGSNEVEKLIYGE